MPHARGCSYSHLVPSDNAGCAGVEQATLLIVLAMVALLAWVGQGLAAQSFSLTRSWLHLVVLFFLVGYAVTSWFSVDRYLSFVGNVGQVQWAFTTVAALVLLYFLIANRVRTTARTGIVFWIICPLPFHF